MEKVAFASPVRLEQDAIDMGQIDDFAAGSDGFEQRGHAEIAGAAQVTLGGADDQIERFGGIGAVGQAAKVQLSVDEGHALNGASFTLEGYSQSINLKIFKTAHY